MGKIDELLRMKIKPKEKQVKLVESVCNDTVSMKEFMDFFMNASDVDKGTCADCMKHVSEKRPEIFSGYIDVLIPFINYRVPRVKWGISQAIGNLGRYYPGKVETAIPALLKNTASNETNTTVIRWCAAYGLTEIAMHNTKSHAKLLPVIKRLLKKEKNNGVKNVYMKAINRIDRLQALK
jgi:hypothetical protein